MNKIYNKLVRDKIPEIIEATGDLYVTEILSDEKYIEMLNLKLNEECSEYQENKNIEELADILEVIYAIANIHGISAEQLENIRVEKANKRGRFENKILLKEVIKQG